MVKHFDPDNLRILKEEYLDKNITSTKLIAILWGRLPKTIKEYKDRLNGTYKKHEREIIKKHKQY